MLRPFSLKFVLALAISIVAFALTALITLTVGQTGIRSVEREIGASLALLADQMQDKLDRGLFERYREIINAARLLRTLDIAGSIETRRTLIETLQETYQDYAWIGFIDEDGKVLSGTNRLLEGVDVSSQPWFQPALEDPTVSDVHEAASSARPLPKRGEEGQRFVHVAAPVLDASGKRIGRLGAHLNWSWAGEVKDSLFGTSAVDRSTEVLVLRRDGSVLLGPPELVGHTLALESMKAAADGTDLFAIETWPGGRRYVTGYAKSDGYRTFAGLGWIVLVRQDARLALAPARGLQRRMLLWSFGLAGLAAAAAWILAGHISAPLLRLAAAAGAIRRGENARIPAVRHYAEAETLARSLDTLVAELRRREVLLAQLNISLESQVAARTRELAERNAALTVARTEAEQATAAKSRFLAAASHDLRQPLHALALFTRALSRRVTGEEATRLVARMEQSLAALKEMFDALLDVSRLDAGLIRPNATDVSVGGLAERVAADFRAEAESRALKFLSRSCQATIRTDAVLIEAMLRNLVSNALKFTKQGGVLLAARRRGGSIAFEVYDTGPGIPTDRHERIFQEFERAKEHATGINDGLGLGLSIVKRYAQLLGIEIGLASRAGRGTRFSLLVPAEASRRSFSDAAVVEAFKVDGAALCGRRILVLDDDASIVSALTRDLADRGADAHGFETPALVEDALRRGFTADAAVVDFDLKSDESGPASIQRMERQLGRSIPTLILTGGTDRATLAAVMATGRPWLTKPADPEAIAAALVALVKKASSG
ncbi:MAG: ATP-binding protein [Hyphomicrobiaceae bacterium]